MVPDADGASALCCVCVDEGVAIVDLPDEDDIEIDDLDGADIFGAITADGGGPIPTPTGGMLGLPVMA
jgi:hypothetical protein